MDKPKDHLSKTVVIVGAGASGLSAARSFVESGKTDIDIIIVESSDYIGGRIKTSSSFIGNGHKIELGAELIHGNNTRLSRFIEEQGLHLHNNTSSLEPYFITAQGDGGPDDQPTKNGMYGAYYLGKEDKILPFDSTDPDFEHLNETFWRMCAVDEETFREENKITSEQSRKSQKNKNTSSMYQEFPDDEQKSLHDYLQSKNISDRMKGLTIAGYANTVGCTDLKRISFAAVKAHERYWETNEESGDFHLHSKISMGGIVDSFVRLLKHKVSILLNWKVVSIDYSFNRKDILLRSHNGQQINADACIISVPVSIINDEVIEFQPPLPRQKIESFKMVGMERAMKIILKFNKKLWPEKLQSIVCSDCEIPEIWFREFRLSDSDNKKPANFNSKNQSTFVAVCFLTSKYADELAKHGNQKAVSIAKEQLCKVFRISSEDMNKSYITYTIFDWKEHDGIRGGYGYPKVGIQRKHYLCMAENVDEKMFFCGESTHLGAGMTIQAAMDTGVRAAEEVLKKLYPT